MKRVLERRPTRAITVFVDMKDVDRAAKKSGDSDNESDDGGQSDVSSIQFCVDSSKPDVTTVFEWTHKN